MAAVIDYFLTGGASNADPDASFGGTTSSVELAETALNNLFANVQPGDTVGSDSVTYRAFSFKNTGDATAKHVEFYLTDTPNVESILEIWYDATGAVSTASAVEEPAGATWSQPLVGSKLAFADMAPGVEYRIWVQRTVDQDATNFNDDTAIFHVWAS